jgi:aspartate ammonia-lyase
MSFRIDKDSLGEVKVPSNAYYGPFTARAINQYKVTGQKAHINLIGAYAMIKRSAALANKELKVLDNDKAQAIIKACDEILAGKLLDELVVEAINSGAGTAFNMNTNEVIANRALEILGKSKGDYEFMSPNDDVNMSQSSNDTFPTAMHVAILLNMNETLASLDKLIVSLQKMAEKFAGLIKMFTHSIRQEQDLLRQWMAWAMSALAAQQWALVPTLQKVTLSLRYTTYPRFQGWT